MPGRSLRHLATPPPPPLISRRSPGRVRVRSPDQHHLVMASSSRGRERREYRPSVRRSRSPVPPPKGRSYSPPLKRKASPIREREIARGAKLSKSPVVMRGASVHRYNVPPLEHATHPVRNVTSSERLRGREYDEAREVSGVPQFRGPEGSVDFDINELKKFTIEIVRKPSSVHGDSGINRSIINPDDIAPVRRPETYEEDYRYYDKGRGKGMRGTDGHKGQFNSRGQYNIRGQFTNKGQFNNHHNPNPRWKHSEEEDSYDYNIQNEGSRPLFLRAEASASTSKDRSGSDDYRRIVAIDPSRGSGSHDQGPSRERPAARYSPVPFEEHRRAYFPERERSPYEARHRSPPREEYIEPRDKPRERRGGSREFLRRDLDGRRKEEQRYSVERRLSYERESDLRSRINEKRSDLRSNPRPEERERGERERRYEGERERHGRSHHSSPSRERKRQGSLDRHDGSRDRRGGGGETWEREREGERKRRAHSRDHSDHHYEQSRRHTSNPHKSDYEPKKFYKNYEEREFAPLATRGRGGPPIRRGGPPIIRGRGIVRGLNRGFRGGMMGGIPRGIPRAPFMPRGFPPRFFPPY